MTPKQFMTFAQYIAQLGVDQAFRTAYDCDAQFSRELIRVYGRRKACNARYLPMHKYTDRVLLYAQARKLTADRRLMDLLQAARA